MTRLKKIRGHISAGDIVEVTGSVSTEACPWRGFFESWEHVAFFFSIETVALGIRALESRCERLVPYGLPSP